MSIPKIIHQIWISSAVPEKYQAFSCSFKKRMPDWEHRIWNDELSEDLVKSRFPAYAESYASLDSPVAKSDLLRYMILFEHGGMYADMDCECKRSLDFVNDNDELIVCKELDTTSSRVMDMYPSDVSPLYCQWAFLSRPQHPALGAVLEHIKHNIAIKHSDHPILDFVKRTGPHAFTAGLTQYRGQGGTFRVVPASYFGCFETKNTLRFMTSAIFPELLRTVYVRHHFAASWLDDKVKKKMMLRNLLLMPERIAKGAKK